MTGLVLIAVAAAVIGAAVGRWAVVVPLTVAWPVFILGLERGWWGNGVGDRWEVSLVLGAVLGAVGGAAGVLARQRLTGGNDLRTPSSGTS